jgi:hypothetical protein
MSVSLIGIPLYYFDYSRIASIRPLPQPEKVKEFKKGKIYLVPVGNVKREFLEELIPYIEERFGYKTLIGERLDILKSQVQNTGFMIGDYVMN